MPVIFPQQPCLRFTFCAFLPRAASSLPPSEAGSWIQWQRCFFFRCSTKQIFLVAEFNHLDAEH